jgi:hypothetical protein
MVFNAEKLIAFAPCGQIKIIAAHCKPGLKTLNPQAKP